MSAIIAASTWIILHCHCQWSSTFSMAGIFKLSGPKNEDKKLPFTFLSLFHKNVVMYKSTFSPHIFVTKWIFINVSCHDIETKLWWKCDFPSVYIFSLCHIFITFLPQCLGNKKYTKLWQADQMQFCPFVTILWWKCTCRKKITLKLTLNAFKYFFKNWCSSHI